MLKLFLCFPSLPIPTPWEAGITVLMAVRVGGQESMLQSPGSDLRTLDSSDSKAPETIIGMCGKRGRRDRPFPSSECSQAGERECSFLSSLTWMESSYLHRFQNWGILLQRLLLSWLDIRKPSLGEKADKLLTFWNICSLHVYYEVSCAPPSLNSYVEILNLMWYIWR